LGYASSFDGYKVVGLGSKTLSTSSTRLEGEIYSLKTGSWRSIPSYTLPNLTGFATPGIHVQGSIYWAVPPYQFILAFDLTTEEFMRTETPFHFYSSFYLVEIRGCLAAYRSDVEIGIVIWTLKNE
jgi:F-box interacting protein